MIKEVGKMAKNWIRAIFFLIVLLVSIGALVMNIIWWQHNYTVAHNEGNRLCSSKGYEYIGRGVNNIVCNSDGLRLYYGSQIINKYNNLELFHLFSLLINGAAIAILVMLPPILLHLVTSKNPEGILSIL